MMQKVFFGRFGAVFEPFSHLFGKWNQIFKLSNYYNVLIFILYSVTQFVSRGQCANLSLCRH